MSDVLARYQIVLDYMNDQTDEGWERLLASLAAMEPRVKITPKVNPDVLKNMLAIAETCRDEGILDDLVHDLASNPASDINNGGMESQIRFILEEMGEEAGCEAIKKAMA